MSTELKRFLEIEAAIALRKLTPQTNSIFGKMNVLQMLEHLAEWISISSGELRYSLQTPASDLDKWKAFLMSEKEFRPNTPNSLISDIPKDATIVSVEEGADMVQLSIDKFFARFAGRENETELHPFFGPLNFDEWLVLNAKHIRHHMRQFGIEI
jgi:hypothetical protein